MDKTGIEIESISDPIRIEGLTGTAQAVEMAKRMNNYVANHLVVRHPEAFAGVPLQASRCCRARIRASGAGPGLRGALVNACSNIGDESTAQYLDDPQVPPFWERASSGGVVGIQ